MADLTEQSGDWSTRAARRRAGLPSDCLRHGACAGPALGRPSDAEVRDLGKRETWPADRLENNALGNLTTETASDRPESGCKRPGHSAVSQPRILGRVNPLFSSSHECQGVPFTVH